jgi:hypothetical protein
MTDIGIAPAAEAFAPAGEARAAGGALSRFAAAA